MPSNNRGAAEQATPDSNDVSTREAILNIAEEQFAAAGYDGASVRDIQRGASANGGAVFYYFGTKQALYEAVFARLVEPLVAERLRRLSRCMAGGEPQLEDVIAAYIEPGLGAGFENAQRRLNFAQIRMQLLQAHYPFMTDMLEHHFSQMGERFMDAFARVLPHLDPRDLQWRYHTMVGALTFAMGGASRLRLVKPGTPEPAYDPGNAAEALRQQIALAVAVFRADPVFPARASGTHDEPA